MSRATSHGLLGTLLLLLPTLAVAQAPPAADADALKEQLAALEKQVAELRGKEDANDFLVADVAVYAKAVEWALRHEEFYKPEYVEHARLALATGLARAAELATGKYSWEGQPGRVIRGFVSAVDGSVQPYCVTLPTNFAEKKSTRWPLHVVLHGRGDQMNEIRFIAQFDNKPPEKDQSWIQLDVYGRGNNGYRWAGETDVFEALNAVKKRYLVDAKRIVLRGFSMGGAGSWHLGLHFPSLWCAVGPGAGFVDFYKYQKQTDKLPPWQDATLKIYDSVDYIGNAFDVPICTYGGENDEQLVASTSMVEAAEKLESPIKLVIGKGVGHQFTPEGYKEYLDFHLAQSANGRPSYPGRKKIRFTTYTLKYNQCEWLTVEELIRPYQPAVVEGEVGNDGMLRLTTRNVAMLALARDVASDVTIDGVTLPITNAARGLLPLVFYESSGDSWSVVSYESSLEFNKNIDLRKRHNLQGPIDDAFTASFVCVRGTGTPLSPAHAAWADWTLDRFTKEWDKWMRGTLRIIDDTAVTDEIMADNHLILFGDPGSNAIIAKVLPRLPLKWTAEKITIEKETYDPNTHGLSLIQANPIVPRRYVVINSGHTMHEKDFRASNAWLFPRLGDIAVQKLEKTDAGYNETTVWADIFNSAWRLSPPQPQQEAGGCGVDKKP